MLVIVAVVIGYNPLQEQTKLHFFGHMTSPAFILLVRYAVTTNIIRQIRYYPALRGSILFIDEISRRTRCRSAALFLRIKSDCRYFFFQFP